MHNSFFFLSRLAKELDAQLTGFSVVSCFTQEKNELMVELNNSKKSFFIKAHVSPGFACLSFPNQFNRARKNSVDLFAPLILKKVHRVFVFQNDRSIGIELEGALTLIFKMHGHQSNVLLLNENKVVDLFQNHLQDDWLIESQALHRTLDWTWENFQRSKTQLHKVFFTLGRQEWNYLTSRGFETESEAEQWKTLQLVHNQLLTGRFYLNSTPKGLSLSLLEGTAISTSSAIEALTQFYLARMQSHGLEGVKQKALGLIHQKLKQSQSYLSKNQPQLQSLLSDTHYQLWGDLVMAHLHIIQKGQEFITLDNFYAPGQAVTIKLKCEVSPQKNAEIFYRKARNQKIEIEKLQNSIQSKLAEIEALKVLSQKLETATSPKEIEQLTTEAHLTRPTQQNQERLPYHEIEFQGFRIRVGKSASDNDALTLKHSFKEDLWLHAQGVSGSHVTVVHQSGKEYPKAVIERAAQLAAYNSKRKGELLCPVAYTPKNLCASAKATHRVRS